MHTIPPAYGRLMMGAQQPLPETEREYLLREARTARRVARRAAREDRGAHQGTNLGLLARLSLRPAR